jgi:DoxX-like family
MMQSDTQSAHTSKGMFRVGWIMSALPSLFLLVDGVMKLVKPPVVVEATVRLGYPENVILGLGIVLLIGTALYLMPLTSVLGAILLTGYLGGAVASHVRVQGGLFPVFFPIILSVLLWGGLFLRYERVRVLLALRN